MKFWIFVTLALFMQIHQTLQAPANKNHEKFMLFWVNDFENSEEVISGGRDGSTRDKTNKQLSEDANLVLIDKTDLMNLVANENAAENALVSILDNSTPKRYRRQNFQARQCPKSMALSLSDNSKAISFADADDLKQKNLPVWQNFDFDTYDIENNLPICPDIEDIEGLNGNLNESFLNILELEEEDILEAHPDILSGGTWEPKHCKARHKIAIIIPYRDRKSHLNRLLNYLIPFLKRQLLNFRFIVSEQVGDDLFNKGRIMNAAFELAQKLKVDCVIFHDVDMFPEDFRIPYTCPENPRHLGAFVSTLKYEHPTKYRVGGVLAMKNEDYKDVNGFSNLYWGWGDEDNDMGKRIMAMNKSIERLSIEFRYTMIKHEQRKRSVPRLSGFLRATAETRINEDGLNSSNRWTVLSMEQRPLYYHLFVNVGRPSIFWRIDSCIL